MLLKVDFLLVFHSIFQHNFFECIYIFWGYPNHFFFVYSSDCFAGKRIKNIYILGGTKTHGDHHLLRPFYRLIGKLRY